MNRTRKLGVALGAAGMLTVSSIGSVAAQDAVPVELLLQWVPQSQFAGYFAADELGYWDELGLDVTILDGGPEVPPQTIGSAPDGPEFAISWAPKQLEVLDLGQSDMVNIAQVFQRSPTTSVSWADAAVNSPAEFAGKKVGVWDFGNEHEVIAAATAEGLTQAEDFEKVIQPFDMSLLLNREVDVAQAMIYNEYAQVLEAVNPETGQLYQPEDFVIIDYNEVGTAMLQDGIYARAAWLAEEGNAELATKFLAGAFKGWLYCRDNPTECVDFVLNTGAILGEGHQNWVMNEINPLIWPSPDGIGAMSVEAFDQTVKVATEAGIISGPPAEGAYRTDLAEAARALLEGEDLTGESFEKGTVTVTEGGE